jgi:hypothetical protein
MVQGEAAAFMRLWSTGLVAPRRAFDALGNEPEFRVGAAAVAIRFGVTALTELLPLAILRRRPFASPPVSLGRAAPYSTADVMLHPIFGLTVWGLMSTTATGALRLSGRPAELGQVMNVVGMGMVIPMPVLWAWDWTAIARNHWRPVPMATSHAAVELWEAALFAVGFNRRFGLERGPAIRLGLFLGGLYVLAAKVIIR